MSSDSLLDQMCIQKKNRAIVNIPPLRLEKPSPYRSYRMNDVGEMVSTSTNFTKRELDMRRKIEILKYQNRNGRQSQRNQFTSLNNIPSSSTRRLSSVECYKDPNKNKNSNADIPGKNIIFEFNPEVPLYNFIPRTEALPSETRSPDVFYRFHRSQGIINMPFQTTFKNSEGLVEHEMITPVTIGLLEFYNNIPAQQITFRLTSTLTLHVDDPVKQDNLTITLNQNDQTHVKIFYSNTELINSKRLNVSSGAQNSLVRTVANPTPSIVINTDIINLPSRTGYIHQFQYNFSGFKIENINPSPGDSFSLRVSNITMEPIYT